tara:strand:+ start:300 stop:551 length:252 start_codon:yes stop_codon:yes gene_type:complete
MGSWGCLRLLNVGLLVLIILEQSQTLVFNKKYYLSVHGSHLSIASLLIVGKKNLSSLDSEAIGFTVCLPNFSEHDFYHVYTFL